MQEVLEGLGSLLEENMEKSFWGLRYGLERRVKDSPKLVVSGIEILKVLEWSPGTGRLSSGIERTRAKIWNHGSRDWR